MRIFNTLSGQKEEFKPRGDVVKMYVCGITPYDECHIGHAMSYIVFDVVRRYLEFKNYQVKYVQNFTDVDDKIINQANKLGIPARELSSKLIAQYFLDMDALNIKRADIYPRVTEEIPKIIEVVQGLINKGHAYQSGGSVYFRVKSYPDYGKLSHRNPQDMIGITYPTMEDEKESPLDFALWKAAKEGEPWWQSPWGRGRPGWHIECSAMALRYLGSTIDIHGGGEDLIFPHHENEIAQSECFTGAVPFARCWMHNGLVQLGKEKMSKSLGNLITIKQILKQYSPDAIRLFVISSHYRSPLTYSEDSLEAAERGVERLRQAVRQSEGEHKVEGKVDPAPYRQRFIEAMDDDFSTAQAVAAIFDLARGINKGREENRDITEAQQTLLELAGVLGLTLKEKAGELPDVKSLIKLADSLRSEIHLAEEWGINKEGKEKELPDAEHLIDSLVSLRSELRSAKQWELADKIRSSLANLGITLEDMAQGTVWKYKHQ